ncbi:hypothetical protein TNIN_291391 [Trichonephila inaurata madagascariensis]|uniref:Uncharacterized protein n=1 Tax=Trichonephila inaurata madagascariensis TaxID=2747483 RepID=A0A8X7BNA0_9ARAC|nr:hypothetical protein TNIN_291391 [Trichonephila inaurata madagascariensis]
MIADILAKEGASKPLVIPNSLTYLKLFSGPKNLTVHLDHHTHAPTGIKKSGPGCALSLQCSKYEQTSPSRLTRATLDHCPTPMVARCFQPAQSVAIPKHILDCLGLDQWCTTFLG